MGGLKKDALGEPAADKANDAQRVGSVDLLVSQILQGVYEGRFVPGQKLVEGELKREYGLGRGTVREALRRLEVEGLIDSSLHRGARIRFFTRDEVRDILEINEHLIATAAMWAAQRHESSRDLVQLLALIDEMVERVNEGDVFGLAKLRRDYMSELVRLGKNKEMFRHLPRMDVTVIRTQFPAAFDRPAAEEDLASYAEIARLVMARDGEGAARVAGKFARNWLLAVQRLPDRYFAK